MSTPTPNTNRRMVAAHQWGLAIRREIDILIAAQQGAGTTATMQALATEAVLADDGTLRDSTGEPGYAWHPDRYKGKDAGAAATARIRAAGASIGRAMVGGHPAHRTYLATLAAIMEVAAAQDYDVTARIELLWDQQAAQMESAEAEEAAVVRQRSWIARVWDFLKERWLGIEPTAADVVDDGHEDVA